MTECRNLGCGRPRRDRGGFPGRFCSAACELEYEHAREDARPEPDGMEAP